MFMRALLSVVLCLMAVPAVAQAPKHYDRTIDLVYLSEGGTDFYMDIFVPNGTPPNPAFHPGDGGKGLALIDIGSGAWYSDRGKLDDHEAAQVYDIFTAHGYTVFAARPGTRPLFTVFEMTHHLQQAIRWVKAHAAEYHIDPDRIGLMGASAGGHLALMTSLSPLPADPNATDPLNKFSTDVQAVGAFFPATNFVNWEGKSELDIGTALGEVLFKGGAKGHTQEEIDAAARKASPYFLVPEDGKTKLPPFNIMHGDADPLVPLQQSEIMVAKLKEAGADVEFYIKPGGGHPWLTIPMEVLKLADWFDQKLKR